VDREYFATTIRPLLAHPLINFLGEVNDQQKRELLCNARALLFPIDWPEPFGLVMIEALACGTPVITRRRGSTPEIIRDGQTGFICETEEDMVAAVHRIGTLNRRACRREFLERFTVTRMAQQYVNVYQAICAEWRAGIGPVPIAPIQPPPVASMDSTSAVEISALSADEGRKVMLPRRMVTD